MKRLTVLVALLLLFCPILPVCAETVFTVSAGESRGFGENPVTLTAPGEGTVSLRITDTAGALWRTLTDVAVHADENTVIWDGLGDNEERLADREYRLNAVYTGRQGDVLQAECTLVMGRCNQALLYALPSCDTLYLGGGDDWFVELQLVRKGTVVMDIYAADAPDTRLDTRQKDVKDDNPGRFSWNGKIRYQPAAPGRYLLRYYASQNPGCVREVLLTISADAQPQAPVAVTGSLFPVDLTDDAAVWQAMMQPSVVVDIGQTSHQKVLDAPGGKSLGTLHGASQGVEVLSIEDGFAKITAWQHEDGGQVTGYVPLSKLKTVTPNSEYGLLVSKADQTMTVYRRGEKITAFPISTGLVAPDRLIRETAAGMFVTLLHNEDFATDGYWYRYPIRYDGGNLIHSVGYRSGTRPRDYTQEESTLGLKASHGCVRMPRQADENGINAYWLYTHLPYHTRIMITDDPLPRQRQKNAAVSGMKLTPQDTASSPVAANEDGFQVTDETQTTRFPGDDGLTPLTDVDLPEDTRTVTLTLGGDAMLGVREKWWDREDALPAYLDKYGLDYPFSGLSAWFSNDDMTFINLECVLKDDPSGEKTDKLYRFRGLTGYTGVLLQGSVEQVNIANNHYIDYGTAGKAATRHALEVAGIPYSGYGDTCIFEKDGLRIGFAGCRETTYRQDTSIINRDIQALRDAGCDAVVYSIHAGTEYEALHNLWQVRMAQEAAAAGADLVVGNHPHVVQGVERMGGTAVLYSLGNLMFGGTIEMTTFDATLARAEMCFDSAGAYLGTKITLVPILTSSRAAEGVNKYHPVPAQGEERARILQKIQADTPFALQDGMFFPAR